MRKLFPFIALAFLISCEKSEIKIKTATYSYYEAVKTDGQFLKGNLNQKFSIGFNEDGTQKFFVGLVGYEGNGQLDTSWHDKKSQLIEKTVENKKFFYTDQNELTIVQEEKGDTTFTYDPKNLEFIQGYYIVDSKKRIVETFDSVFEEREIFTERKYNQEDLLIESLLIREYFPNQFSKKYKNEMEIAEKKARQNQKLILQIEYDYH
jgi:hypothetical protein